MLWVHVYNEQGRRGTWVRGWVVAAGSTQGTHNPLYGCLIRAARPAVRILTSSRPSTNLQQMGSAGDLPNRLLLERLARTGPA